MDLSKAMRNLQETKKVNSKEIAKVAKALKENKSLKEGIIDDLQKGKPTEKRDGSKAEIDKAVKEDKELDAVNKNRGIGMMSDEDQEKYYYDTYEDTNGTFYDVYKMDGKLYDVLGNEVKEKTEAKLNEDQYEADRRKGRPNIKELAAEIYEDEKESWKKEASEAKDEADFIQKVVAEVASENNLRENSAKQIYSIIYKKATSKTECAESQIKDEKKLTELRHVDKKVIVKAYDFSELSEKDQKALINEYFTYRGNRRDRGETPKDIVINDLNDQFGKAMEGSFFKPGSIFRSSREPNPEEVIEDSYFDTDITLDQLSSELEWDGTYYTKVEVSGSLGSKWSSISKKILERLSQYTNYDELSKASKREIISKINDNIEKLKTLITEYCGKAKEELANASDSIADFEKLRNKPAVEELSKYWYTENGQKIISKEKAKVVEGEVNEALITEAPVNLEMDYGYDVYSYDDLDDYGKKNAFNSTERSRKNEYDKTFNKLKEKISELVNEELTKVGLKLDASREESLTIRSFNKGSLSGVYIYLDPDSLVSYAKENNIDLQPVCKVNGVDRRPYAVVSLSEGRYSGLTFSISLNYINAKDHGGSYDGYDNDEEVRKQLENELELDLKGLQRKIVRLDQQFKDAIDDDFRNKMSTDRKLKRREYDSKGNIYRGKDKE